MHCFGGRGMRRKYELMNPISKKMNRRIECKELLFVCLFARPF